MVLTSTYPRWEKDTEPAFVHELSKRLTNEYDVHVIAPHFRAARVFEVLDGVSVHRFRYCIPSMERLAYEGGMLSRLKESPWQALMLPLFLSSQFICALRVIIKYRVSLVHAHWVVPQGLVGWLLRIFSPAKALLVTSHGGDVYGLRGGLLSRIKRAIYRRANAVTVVSEAMRQQVEAQVAGTLEVAPMGVDLRHRFVVLDDASGRQGLVFVGRLVEKKGVDVLLRAYARLSPEMRSQAPLTLVGDGPLRAGLEALAAELGIEAQTQFLGALANDRLPAILNRHAIAVVPSVVASSGDQEGLGLVTIEAMGCGCAVIASDLPAIRDVVEHGENGLLAEVGNPVALAEALERLVSDDSLRLSLAARGRELALERFDWSIATGRYRKLYEALLEHHPAL